MVILQGPLVAGRRAPALKLAVGEAGSGPGDERTRRLARDPALWIVILACTTLRGSHPLGNGVNGDPARHESTSIVNPCRASSPENR